MDGRDFNLKRREGFRAIHLGEELAEVHERLEREPPREIGPAMRIVGKVLVEANGDGVLDTLCARRCEAPFREGEHAVHEVRIVALPAIDDTQVVLEQREDVEQ